MADYSALQRHVVDRQTRMFSSFVGRGLTITREALAAASGVPASSLREYALGAAMPIHAVLAIRPHLPGAAINMLTEPGDARIVDATPTAANWDAVACGSARLTAAICHARADGRIDHIEEAELRREGRELIAKLSDAVDEGE